ncbi:IctB family putative bicarbonate transporter [Gloeocapsa sp. PCC 73106]|uniref:IctB family putative bicarbonate transporter n=1 Tax=Gloeocapsa sp. PCC 73106 TaxID=102232 RepID=UPI0002AC6E3E|nr:IctB family putative bicarbonate transporter [Gloeocapsa sp. PCC 73106]ELR98961.1 putative bicarbonate transporter, IctB family [Gloeocapsa sp. PCC 73106]
MNFVSDDWIRASLTGRLIGSLASWKESSWVWRWSKPLGALLLALVLGLAPFVSNGIVGLLLVGVGFFWLVLTLCEREKIDSGGIAQLVFLYWAIATVATAFSPVKTAALDGWIKLTLYLMMFALSAQVLRSPRLCSWLITIFLHTSLIVSIYGVRQRIFGADALATWNDPDSPLAQSTRVYSYLGNPNLLAGYLLGAIALSLGAIFVWRGWWGKALAVTIFVLNSACLYFTSSRGGWLALAGLLVTFFCFLYYWYFQFLPQWGRLWIIPIVPSAIALTGTIAFFRVESLRLRLLSIFAGREDSSNNFRLNVWGAVIEMIRDYPILGIGPGNQAFNEIYPLYMRPNFTSLGAYSIYLEMTVEMGLIGLASFLVLIATIFYRGLTNLQRLNLTRCVRGFWLMGAMAGLVGMLVQGLVDVIWYRPQVNTIWWFLVAIVASFGVITPSRD